MSRSRLDAVRYALLTGFGSGLAPFAPGTFGTLPGVVIGIVAGHFLDGGMLAWTALALAAALFAFGASQSAFLRRRFGGPDPTAELDPGAVVLDEIVGYLVALALFVPLFGEPAPWGTVSLFLAFRACDILKPPPIPRLEELPGALGVMADDVLAGIYAAPLAGLLAALV
ncbi:MAG: phosphatidylglycerophosphatase A [Planctomycetes bacterium]|nr:phosphatidylglycerophosphatase A [Planctomycetota bacterium]